MTGCSCESRSISECREMAGSFLLFVVFSRLFKDCSRLSLCCLAVTNSGGRFLSFLSWFRRSIDRDNFCSLGLSSGSLGTGSISMLTGILPGSLLGEIFLPGCSCTCLPSVFTQVSTTCCCCSSLAIESKTAELRLRGNAATRTTSGRTAKLSRARLIPNAVAASVSTEFL